MSFETSYSLLGRTDLDESMACISTPAHIANLAQAGYTTTAGILVRSNITPLVALQMLDGGHTAVAEGAIIGPHEYSGNTKGGFSLYERSEPNPQSIVNILDRCVRVSSDLPDSAPWERRATIIDRCEGELPILVPRLIEPNNTSQPVADQIWSILSNPYFRRGTFENLQNHIQHFQGTIDEAVDSGVPLRIVLPTVPFKDQNPTTTGQPIGMVDLGEHAFVAQLRDLVDSVGTVYEPGVHIELVADGQVYREIFTETSQSEVSEYSQNITRLIDVYGLSGQVNVVDFSDIIASDEDFEAHRYAIEQILAYQRGSRVINLLRSLQRGMLMNCQFAESSIEQIVDLSRHEQSEWPEAVRNHTLTAARRYAAFLITAAQRQTLDRAFPGSIRATVHPKDAPQLPLNLISRRNCILPYNGVPVVPETSQNNLRRNLRIVRLSSLLATDAEFYRHHDTQGRTMFYKMSTKGQR